MKQTKTFNQVLLVIFDGWGYTTDKKYNAIYEANPKFFNSLWENYPHSILKASGEAIGLPKGQIGTSEIAHTTIGAGKVIYTDLVRVNREVRDHTLCANDALQKLFAHVLHHNSTLHFIGQLSPGGVHSHQDHLFALLSCAKKEGITKIAIDVFTDGRDEPPQSADVYLSQLENFLKKLGIGRIATMTGRYYAMDRDTNWDRTEKAERALFSGEGNTYTIPPSQVAVALHKEHINDEFFEPCVFVTKDGEKQVITKNDGVFFFNFRPDRAVQLAEKIALQAKKLDLFFVTLTKYASSLPALVAFPKIKLTTTLAGEIARRKLTQTHIAETEKFAHLTYFFDGEREKPYPGETYELIPSRKVATHDLAPQMRAWEIAQKAIVAINSGTNFVVINFANPDMVGHSGKLAPTIKAIQFTDRALQPLVEAVLNRGGVAVITSDHGNAEVKFNEKTNQPQTAHTLNPVPCIITEKEVSLRDGTLSDVAPTILQLFGIPKPKEMTGESLVRETNK